MTTGAFLTHLLFGICLLLLSCSICWFMVRRVRIMDVPNERSSHDAPVPKAGGLAIVITFIAGVMVLYLIADNAMIGRKFFLGFVCPSILIAVVSFYDDLYDLSPLIRLIPQTICTIAVMMFGLVLVEINIPWIGKVQLGFWGYLISFVWIIGLTNAYNFMDGINGIAGGTAVIACIFFSIICLTFSSSFIYLITYALMAGVLGFLVFNFPIGRLFMGNVGSNFLGFVFAVLAIFTTLQDSSHSYLFVMPLLMFHFIYEA